MQQVCLTLAYAMAVTFRVHAAATARRNTVALKALPLAAERTSVASDK